MKFIKIIIFYSNFINHSCVFSKSVNDFSILKVLKFVNSFQYKAPFVPLCKTGDEDWDFSKLVSYDFAFGRFEEYLLNQEKISKIVEGEI